MAILYHEFLLFFFYEISITHLKMDIFIEYNLTIITIIIIIIRIPIFVKHYSIYSVFYANPILLLFYHTINFSWFQISYDLFSWSSISYLNILGLSAICTLQEKIALSRSILYQYYINIFFFYFTIFILEKTMNSLFDEKRCSTCLFQHHVNQSLYHQSSFSLNCWSRDASF